MLGVIAAALGPGCWRSSAVPDGGIDGAGAADSGPDARRDAHVDAGPEARDAGSGDSGDLDAELDARDAELDSGSDAGAEPDAPLGDGGDAAPWDLDGGEPDAAIVDAGLEVDAATTVDAGPRRIVEVGTGLALPPLACVRFDTGAVRCWGDNLYGALGIGRPAVIGDDEPASAGEDVRLGEPAVQLAVGAYFVCALLSRGRVRCWGEGSYGQLGYASTANIGDDEPPSAAGDVPIGGRAIRVAVGAIHTCALLDGGRVRCWGENDVGQLGYANTYRIGDDETPESAGDVFIGAPAIDVCAGAVHTCALLESRAVRCWGNGVTGALGYGNSEFIGDNESPASAGDVPIGEPVLQLSCGWTHTCVLLEGGRVRCWGENYPLGKLGVPGVTSLVVGDEPGEIPALLPDIDVGGPVARVSARVSHTCALLESGSLRCWGGSYFGQLGYASTDSIGDDETPASAGDVDVGGSIALLAHGFYNTCVVLTTGGLRCWGVNHWGQLGYGHTMNIGDDETPASAGDVPLF